MKLPTPRKLPSGNWFIQLRIGGQSVSITEATEKACVRRAQLVKAEYQAGRKTAQSKEKSLTLSQAVDKYIESRENILSPSTIRGYRTIQRTRFQAYIDKDITKIDYQKMCNDEARICAAKTLTNAWRFVCSALRFSGYNPPSVSLPQVVVADRPFLTPDQVKIFVDAAKGDPCEIPALLALSSLRRSEIVALRWENIDLKNKIIKVSGAAVYDDDFRLIQKKENKNKTSARTIPILMPELWEALERVEDKIGLVCTKRPNTLWCGINRICKRANLPEVGVHGLRHSFASLAYHLGVPEKITMEIGGWADHNTMRKIYTHIAKQDVDRYKTKLQDFFENANKNANE